MRRLVMTGKTVDEALAAACAELGVSRDDLNVSYQVLEMPGKTGFLGLKTTPAKVEVTVEEEEAPAPAAPVVEETPAPAPVVEPVVVEEAPAAEEPAAQPVAEEPAEESAPAADEEVAVPVEIESDPRLNAAVQYLTEVFAAMGVTEVTFSAVQKGEATILKVEGDNVGALIGRRGETMESLSYLASLVANRQKGEYVKLGLDVAGYRGKREADLEALARRIGAKVAKSGRPFAMEPMNPYERRLIHSAIGKMEGLRSESRGEGSDRRVVIYCTGPNAKPERPARKDGKGGKGGRGGERSGRGGRGQGQGGKGRGGRDGSRRGPRPSSVPAREFADRTPDPSAVPQAPVRTQRINDAADFELFGKIEL